MPTVFKLLQLQSASAVALTRSVTHEDTKPTKESSMALATGAMAGACQPQAAAGMSVLRVG